MKTGTTVACGLGMLVACACSAGSSGGGTDAGAGAGTSGADASGGGMAVPCKLTFTGATTDASGCFGSLSNSGTQELMGFQITTGGAKIGTINFLAAVDGTFSVKTYAAADLDSAVTAFGAVPTAPGGPAEQFACKLTAMGAEGACTGVNLTLTSVDPAPSSTATSASDFGGDTPAESRLTNTHGTLDVTIPGTMGTDNKGNPIAGPSLTAHVAF